MSIHVIKCCHRTDIKVTCHPEHEVHLNLRLKAIVFTLIVIIGSIVISLSPVKAWERIYKILDEQAIAGATKKVAADKLKEERKGEKQKRSRVTVKTVKKEGADKVFSANKNGDLTKAKTLDSGGLPPHGFYLPQG